MGTRREYPTDPTILDRYPIPKVIGAHDPELAGLLDDAIETLSPRQREWAEMASAGMSPIQIAREWGTTQQTVNTTRHRAIMKLRREHGLRQWVAENTETQKTFHSGRNLWATTGPCDETPGVGGMGDHRRLQRHDQHPPRRERGDHGRQSLRSFLHFVEETVLSVTNRS
jgi:Bacterial regulatory proteins, luxR family